MKDSTLIAAFVLWAAGVIVGSQVCRQPADPNAAGSPAVRQDSPAGRLACAIVELGDAIISLPQKFF